MVRVRPKAPSHGGSAVPLGSAAALQQAFRSQHCGLQVRGDSTAALNALQVGIQEPHSESHRGGNGIRARSKASDQHTGRSRARLCQ
eukprot:1275740-Amphidinium_carterae.1